MMKNRKLLYILIPATLFVWGWIAYTIYGNLHKPVAGETEYYNMPVKHSKDSLKQGYELLANYRDPFGASAIYHRSSGSRKTFVRKPIPMPTNAFQQRAVWPAVLYMGIVINESKRVALLRVENSNLLMQEGFEEKGITLYKMYPDSVILGYRQEQKTFRKQQGNGEYY